MLKKEVSSTTKDAPEFNRGRGWDFRTGGMEMKQKSSKEDRIKAEEYLAKRREYAEEGELERL